MTKATITYYGHSCFKVEAQGSSIVFDPYADGSVPGLRVPRGVSADAVSCSHGHADHNAAALITLTGREPALEVERLTVPHDHHGGTRRGLSDIVTVRAAGITIAHLGDLGRLPTEEEYAVLAQADVALVPCAGYYTIGPAEAAEVIARLKHPCLKVLMHFREGERGYGVQETIEAVAGHIKGIRRLEATSVSVEAGSIPDEIITLEPQQ